MELKMESYLGPCTCWAFWVLVFWVSNIDTLSEFFVTPLDFSFSVV